MNYTGSTIFSFSGNTKLILLYEAHILQSAHIVLHFVTLVVFQ